MKIVLNQSTNHSMWANKPSIADWFTVHKEWLGEFKIINLNNIQNKYMTGVHNSLKPRKVIGTTVESAFQMVHGKHDGMCIILTYTTTVWPHNTSHANLSRKGAFLLETLLK